MPVTPLAANIRSAISRVESGFSAVLRTSRALRNIVPGSNPPVRLAPADGDGAKIVAGLQQLDDSLDVPHAVGKAFGLPLVVVDLAGEIAVEAKQGGNGSCGAHARNVGRPPSRRLWRLLHNTG